MSKKRSRWYARLGWGVMMVFSSMVALYTLSYLVLGEQVYVEVLVESFLARPWGIYTHAFFAMIALALGPFQFRGLMIEHRPPIHRTLGKIYVVGALMTGLSGLYMAFYAYGGWITQLGFGTMAVALLTTTTMAYLKIRARQIVEHRAWMIRSFSVLFAAVTLRLWLPVLTALYDGDFTSAYQWVAWVSWVPNLIGADWYVRRLGQRGGATATEQPFQRPTVAATP